ncbi:uracil-DNA glycosylase [Spirochaeta dissipatitropha]
MTQQVWELLNDLEDIMNTGYRSEHSPPPDPSAVKPDATVAASASAATDVSTAPGTKTGSMERGAAVYAQPGYEPAASGSPAAAAESISELAELIQGCTLCGLSTHRDRTVPGTGALHPLVFAAGDAPGADEDRTGLPFVGQSGEYLDKWLKAIDLSRHKNVFISNALKCHTPDYRSPGEGELNCCFPYLQKQVELLQPACILALGRTAGGLLTGRMKPLSALRGSVHSYRGIPLIVTYHPNAVLKNQALRSEVWADLQLLRDTLRKLRSDYRPLIR